MINIRLFHNALMLAEQGNFARAARALGISQPTLTRSIQTLENMLGENLFDRGNKGVSTTQAGQVVLKHARMIIASSGAMKEELGRYRGLLTGSVSIGSGPYAGTALLSAAIGRFNQRFPEIEISTSVGDWINLPDKLMQAEFDFVLMESSQLGLSQDFELIGLNRHQGFIFCRPGHPLFEKENLKVSDLSSYPLVFPVIPNRLLNLLMGLFFPDQEPGSSPGKLKHIFSDDVGMIKAAVLHSDSIAVATFGMLSPELKVGLYKMLPFRIPQLCSGYDIIKRKGMTLNPAAMAFMDVLIEIDKEQSVLELDLVESLGSAIVA